MKIYSRSDWNARQPRLNRMVVQSSPLYAFLHHSADVDGKTFNTLAKQRAHVRGVQNFHMDDPAHMWADIGYHFIITQYVGETKLRVMPRVFQCRLTGYVPAAQEGFNTRTLAVCVVGNGALEILHAETQKVIAELLRKYPTLKSLRPHSANPEHPGGTECPGRVFRSSIPDIARRAGLEH